VLIYKIRSQNSHCIIEYGTKIINKTLNGFDLKFAIDISNDGNAAAMNRVEYPPVNILTVTMDNMTNEYRPSRVESVFLQSYIIKPSINAQKIRYIAELLISS